MPNTVERGVPDASGTFSKRRVEAAPPYLPKILRRCARSNS